MILRIADGIMVPLFLFSVAVQYNDPDPVRWMAIYLAGAIASAWSAWRSPAAPRLLPFAATTALVALAWALSIAPRVAGTPGFPTFAFGDGMQNDVIEETREMFGLLITATWTAVIAARAASARRSTRE